jgi:hypothetical protein
LSFIFVFTLLRVNNKKSFILVISQIQNVWRSLAVAERNLCFNINSCLQFFASWTVVELIVSPAIVTPTVPQATLEHTRVCLHCPLSPSHQVLLHLLQHEACCCYKSLNKACWRSCSPKRASRICKRCNIPERLFPQWHRNDKITQEKVVLEY